MNWKSILNVAGSVGSAASPWLGAATGVLGSILGSKSQNKANEANLQMTRETNLANQAMNNANIDAARQNLYYQTQQNMAEAQRGRDFEAKQLELARRFNSQEAAMAREYSSAKNEVARMLGAGLNPAAINGNGEGQAIMASGSPVGSAPVGSAGTQPLPSSIPMQAGHVEPVMNQLAAVGALLQDSYKISRDVAQRERERGTSERGQDLVRRSAKEANANQAVIANAAQNTAETGAHVAEKNIQLIDQQIEYQELVNKSFPQKLESELKLNAAQAYSLTESVSVGYANVAAVLRRISADLQMNHNNLASSWNQYGAQLEQEWNMFTNQLDLQYKQFGLDDWQKREYQGLLRKQFESDYGGLNKLWNFLGVKQLSGAVNSLVGFMLGKAM